jgi:hypothetical protein
MEIYRAIPHSIEGQVISAENDLSKYPRKANTTNHLSVTKSPGSWVYYFLLG